MHDKSVDGTNKLVRTGIAGLDDILRGGLTANRLYLVEGTPGAGKTTLALQFLLEGHRLGEPVTYVTLAETRLELEMVAESHEWDLSGIEICELVPSEEKLSPETERTIFHPAEVELGEATKAMLSAIEKTNPQRIVLDSLSELRMVAQSSLRYRRQILALKQYFSGRRCTVLMLDDLTADSRDAQLHSIAHGVITLEQLNTEYGAERRRLRVATMRGVAVRGGLHDFMIRTGGLDVFPRLVAAEHHSKFEEADLPSGNEALDKLLGGGLLRGTSTLLLGPAGTGKSVLTTMFAIAAAKRGERTCLFAFDEGMGTLLSRSRKIGLDLEPHIKSGMISVRQIDPAELSPGEFIAMIRHAVNEGADQKSGARMIIIDSLNGYMNAMPEENFLIAQLHELLAYLGQRGVLTLMTVAQAGMVGSMQSPVDTTYLADNVVLFRFFEANGQIRRAISVVKKRSGPHERTIREMHISSKGVEIGPALEGYQGVLSGTPRELPGVDDPMRSPNGR
ncbi:ATPase domain-containing protein [soil metagenome]